MPGHFKVKKITNLDDLKVDDIVPESDYSHLSKTGQFVQFEYVRDKVETKVEVEPGIWSVKDTGFGLKLVETSFTADNILEDFLSTEFIIQKANSFFNKLDVYKKYGIDVPKRGIVLYGPPGGGKSEAIKKICKAYNNDKETCVLIWPTDKIESHAVKEFIKTFEYKNVKKIILIMEDLGGVEVDQVRIQSESSLLSLLDNQEKIFKLPILIIATTNYPEVFMGNLMNRPGRFDDKVEVPYPTGAQRLKLFQFFLKSDNTSNDACELIQNRKTEEFTPAHIKEVIIRSAIHDKSHLDVMFEVIEEIEAFKKAFAKHKAMGFRSRDDD